MTTFNNRRRKKGFSLVEMMVATSLLGTVVATILPTFTVFTKSAVGLGHYVDMSQQSRGGLERISRDFRTASGLTIAAKDEAILSRPAAAGGGTIRYQYNATTKTLKRTVSPASGATFEETMFNSVDAFEFAFFNRLGVDVTEDSSVLNEAKSVQVNATLQKNVITTSTTDYIISARFLMRNK